MTVESTWYASFVDGRAPVVRMMRREILDDPEAWMLATRTAVQTWCLDRGRGQTTTAEPIAAIEDRELVEHIVAGRR